MSSSDPAIIETPDSAPDAVEAKKQGTDWWAELKAIFWLILAVLAFHSFIAKPFYIPSESMMPGLLKGDRLVVSKYPYGWSWVSPSFHILPQMQGRLFGRMPERGDIVILTPPGKTSDYIKRVIGLPGDTVQMVRGRLWLNGKPVRTVDRGYRRVQADANLPCSAYGRDAGPGTREGYCRLHVLTETLPGGRSYEVLDLYPTSQDDTEPYRVPAGHVFLLGDNRDNSADSRFPLTSGGLGGAVPVEAIGGRAELVTFSLRGEATWNPATWLADFRTERSGVSLRPRK